MERMSRLITANEVKQKQQEHNSRIQVNEDLVEQVTHELMSNDEFVKECNAVMDKSITKQVEQAVADDNNDTDHFYISMTDLADRGEFWLANDDFMVADGKTGRLLFKYLPPILKKLHVEPRQEWYRRETFTLRRLILKPLAKELNKQMTKHWHIKLAEMGYKVQ